jgi:hypothetical protein
MIIDQVYVLKADTYIGGIAVLLHSECRGIKLASTYRAQTTYSQALCVTHPNHTYDLRVRIVGNRCFNQHNGTERVISPLNFFTYLCA